MCRMKAQILIKAVVVVMVKALTGGQWGRVIKLGAVLSSDNRKTLIKKKKPSKHLVSCSALQ